MAHTDFYEFERDNGPDEAVTEITVTYSVASWGCPAQVSGPAEGCYPAEPMEIDILSADTPFGPIVLRGDEVEQVETWVAENPPEPTYGPEDGDYHQYIWGDTS
jgi:hypothetical protein